MVYRIVLCSVLLLCACNAETTSDGNTDQVPEGPTAGEEQTGPETPAPDAPIDLGMPTRADSRPGKLFPLDEGPLSPEFVAFRTELLQAVQRRDTAFIMKLVDRESKISFGGEGGKHGFRIMWGIGDEYAQSPLWDVLDDILRMGGKFESSAYDRFIAPYTFATWPDAYDAFETAVVTGSNVRIRSAPGIESEVLTALSYDIVGYQGNRTPEPDTIGTAVFPWYQITLDDGRSGWIFGQYFRSPIDFRAAFERVKDGWRLAFLVAGD